ncbi:Uncharacterized protein HZ326_26939 [Fusarium oxysporum f. sp. albedinis]|nr:Uncharacterized protein HZ326_26939 [Fusarium oxysporum f. sp. albedinis]
MFGPGTKTGRETIVQERPLEGDQRENCRHVEGQAEGKHGAAENGQVDDGRSGSGTGSNTQGQTITICETMVDP